LADLDTLLDDLVIANRILAHEGVVDAYGHVTVRHPDDPERYFMSRSRSPELVSRDDIMEIALGGEPVDAKGRRPYLERPIHGGVYEARDDVHAVVHNHAYDIIPFTVTNTPLRPMIHTAAGIGLTIPVWDIRDKFGDTNMLVTTIEQGRDLARTLGANAVALMRGHGCVVAQPTLRHVVLTSIYLQVNARLQLQAMGLGDVTYLSSGEYDAYMAIHFETGPLDRAWEYFAARAGFPGRANQ
jgi:HCOMODA/2-hydroxy-3-carboxy-muconic semialdehyde decarboxylase